MSRDTIVENDRYFSTDGRFCLVLRQFEAIPDLGGRRADRLFDFPRGERTIAAGGSWVFTQPDRGHYASDQGFPALTAALYDRKRRVAKIRLDSPWLGGRVLLSDSGRYVVLFSGTLINNTRRPVLSIYRADGSLVESLFLEELLSPRDAARGMGSLLSPRILEKDASGRDLVLLTIPESSQPIRIDLATGARLGELFDLEPPPRP